MSSNQSKWLYFVVVLVAGVFLFYWLVKTVAEPLIKVRQLQKTIKQDLATGKFSDFQKQLETLQRAFPTGNFSAEKISKIAEDLRASKQLKPPVEK